MGESHEPDTIEAITGYTGSAMEAYEKGREFFKGALNEMSLDNPYKVYSREYTAWWTGVLHEKSHFKAPESPLEALVWHLRDEHRIKINTDWCYISAFGNLHVIAGSELWIDVVREHAGIYGIKVDSYTVVGKNQ